jgi:hypothetical protein
MTDNSPINISKQPVPEGWILIAGKNLTNIARPAKIAFRIAESSPAKCGHPISAGIIIQTQDKEAWDAAQAKSEARRIRESVYPSRTKKTSSKP